MPEQNTSPDAPQAAPVVKPPVAVTPTPVLEEPSAGGSYLRDPSTGALTLVTPSTVQE